MVKYCFYCEKYFDLALENEKDHFDVGEDFEGTFECVEERDNNEQLRDFIARNKE